MCIFFACKDADDVILVSFLRSLLLVVTYNGFYPTRKTHFNQAVHFQVVAARNLPTHWRVLEKVPLHHVLYHIAYVDLKQMRSWI